MPYATLLRSCAVFLTAALLVAGCAGSSPYDVEDADIARGYLPTERKVPHAPDSLVHLTLVEKEGRIAFEAERSLEAMLRAWSSTWQSAEGGSALSGRLDYHSYATLWSLEASLMSLQPERGLTGLTKNLARKTLAERREEFREVVQIDVFRFAGSPPSAGLAGLRLDGPGERVELEDEAGRTYAPLRIEAGLPTQAFIGSRTVLYARNTLLFKRFVEGRDLLQSKRLRLEIRQPQLTGISRYYFAWTFPEAAEAGVASSSSPH